MAAWPNWVLGNHDRPRIASRVGEAQARVAAMLLLTLRGTPTLYYGDEIGMADVAIPPTQVQDPRELREPGLGLGRDPVRTPMAWDDNPNGGFTAGTPWLPLHADAATRNVAAMRAGPASILTLTRDLLALRRAHPALAVGGIEEVFGDDAALHFRRTHKRGDVVVALNLGGSPTYAYPVVGRRMQGAALHPRRAGGRLRRSRRLRYPPPERGADPEGVPVRIAMLAPIAWRTPPRHYGPWELVTSLLTEALVARGVDVTLFATRDSITAATLAGVVPAPYSEDPGVDAKVWEFRHLAHLFERASEFDLIHNQADFPAHAFSGLVSTPMVTTIHGFSSERILPMYAPYQDRVRYVAISEADRHPDLRYAATIHHGVPLDDFPFIPAGSDDLLFFGRIHPDKGAKEAIAVAKATGRRLAMYGIVQDEGYHAREVAPRIDGDRVRHFGTVGGEARTRALGGAAALLHLINFDEPFGLSVIEAMACGTPVIARRRGSMPELIDHGMTGFLVDSVEEAITAVGRLAEIDRAACRAAVVERFTVERMADRYLALYRSILGS